MGRIESSALSLLLSLVTATGCAGTNDPRPTRAGNCDRAWPCTVITTELSLAQRVELASTIDARIADRTLIGVAYDGVNLRMLPECMIEGRYVRREAGLEHSFDADSAAFVVEHPHVADRFVRVEGAQHASFRATARVVLPGLAGRAALGDPSCEGLTHVVEELIVGVDPDAHENAEALPVALVLDEVTVEVPRPTRPAREPIDEFAVVGIITGVVLVGALITVCVVSGADCDFDDDDEF